MRVAILILLGSGLWVAMMAQPQAAEEPRPAAAEAKKAPAAAAKGEKESPKAATPAPAQPGKGEVLLAPPAPPGPPVPVKTRMVRALLDALNGIQGLEPEQKDGVTRSLLSADEELSRVLGGNSKRLILRANKKPPILVVGGPSRPVLVVPEGPVPPPAAVPPVAVPPVAVPNPTAAPPGPGKNSAVQTLLKTLDGMQGEDPKVKEELKKILLETERKLNQPPGKQP